MIETQSPRETASHARQKTMGVAPGKNSTFPKTRILGMR